MFERSSIRTDETEIHKAIRKGRPILVAQHIYAPDPLPEFNSIEALEDEDDSAIGINKSRTSRVIELILYGLNGRPNSSPEN